MSSSENAASPRRAPEGRSPMHKRVLALVASLSMILVGLVGVVMAPAASAWSTSQTASAQCQKKDGTNENTGKVVISGTFNNTEPNQPQWVMGVKMTAGGQSDGPKSIAGQANGSFSGRRRCSLGSRFGGICPDVGEGRLDRHQVRLLQRRSRVQDSAA